MHPSIRSGERFGDTRWSLVAAAGAADPAAARDALIALCRRYWYPVYAYIRGLGHAPALARDLTQGYFEHLVHARPPLPVSGDRGRFREYLLATLGRFLDGDWRDGDAPRAVPEFAGAPSGDVLEARHQQLFVEGHSPEQAYQRGYALEVLDAALTRLREEAEQAGRLALFEAMRPWLGGEPDARELARIAGGLGLKPIAAIVALARLRSRFRELAVAELGETVSDGDGLADERALMARALQRE